MEAWQEKRNLAESVTYAFDHSLWTDVELVCTNENGETLQIKAHKMMLASRSPVFEAMLFGPAADKGNTIQITTFSYEQMDLLIRIENVCERLDLALQYDNASLRDAACDFIDENASTVIQTDGFLMMSQNCLMYVLKGDTFHVDEKKIFQRAIDWVRRNSMEDQAPLNLTFRRFRKMLGSAFNYIRLGSLSFLEFSECAERGFHSKEMVYFMHYTNNCTNEKFKEMRMPKIESVEIYTGYNIKKIKTSVTSSFLIKVNKTMFCKGIKLSDFSICHDPKLDQYDRRIDLERGLSLTIEIRIYPLGFSYRTTLKSLAQLTIKFKNPLQLEKSQRHYELYVTATVKLPSLTLTIETSEVDKGSKRLHVGKVEWSSQPLIVSMIMFTNLSDRDLAENDVEDDDDNEEEDDNGD
ncbi:BTBD9-like protein [Mya arenaria]|uniref:BTBD9-like protein n=1 Tax=Mya arenaria TaxID=6604 RepID=A0ABY7G4V1_MYAAR|nr:BTBD9-like protein [Mya arenaria]